MSLCGFCGPIVRWVYGGSKERTLAVTVCLSWVMMNLIALAIENRTEMLLHPGGQYKAFYFGDLICLPGIAWAIWYLGLYMPLPNQPAGRLRRWWAKMAVSKWWYGVWMVIAVASGIAFHQLDSMSHFYTRSQTFSPTKLYHDFIVVPGFVYLLFAPGLPAVFASKGGRKARLWILVLLAAYIALNVYDNNHRPHHGHENFPWSHFLGHFGL